MSDCNYISASEAAELLDSETSVMLLDMRDHRAWCQGHDSHAIPLSDLTLGGLLRHTPRHVHMIFMCADGSESPEMAELFSDFGFRNCYSLDGGYAAWIERPYRQRAPAQRQVLRAAAIA